MLRAATKQLIFAALDESYFGASNFSIAYGIASPISFRIKFIPNPNFVFTMKTSETMPSSYMVSESPGLRLLSADHHSVNSLDSAITRISGWAERIKEEVIDSNPVARELQAIRAKLDERIDALAESQEEFFTQSEATELANRVQEFSDRLNALGESNAELRDTVASLSTRLRELSEATQQVNKGTWLRMASSKLLGVAKSVFASKEAPRVRIVVAFIDQPRGRR